MDASCKDCEKVEETFENKGRWEWTSYFGKQYICGCCNKKLNEALRLARNARRNKKDDK